MARTLEHPNRAAHRRPRAVIARLGAPDPQPQVVVKHGFGSPRLVCVRLRSLLLLLLLWVVQVNEGLMAIFFFVVGLEIKQEITQLA